MARKKPPTYYCSTARCPNQWRDVRWRKCRACGAPTTRNKPIPKGHGAPVVIADFPEHYNVSMGCVVKSRAHHKQIQRERGLQDWEPTNNSPGSQLSMGRRR